MSKNVFLFTGTPCVGKTTIATRLAEHLDAIYVNLTDLAKTNGLVLEEDKARNTLIVDEKKMKTKLTKLIQQTADKDTVIIDGHYAAAVVPKKLVTKVFVLRRNPKELKVFMQKNEFPQAKMYENLSAEILDVCLIEALKLQKGKVCEVDLSGKTVEFVEAEIITLINEGQMCSVGIVDWLDMLEREGQTTEYLKDA